MHALDNDALPEGLKNIVRIADAIVRMHVLPNFIRDYPHLRGRLYVHFSGQMSFGGSVIVREGVAAIVIPVGTLFTLLGVFSKTILNDPSIFELITHGTEGAGRRSEKISNGHAKFSNLMPQGDLKPLFKYLSISGDDIVEKLNCVTLDQFGFVIACVTTAVQFIVLHEIGHVGAGHVAYLAKASTTVSSKRVSVDYNDISGTSSLTIFHMFELAADIIAQKNLIREIIKGQSLLSSSQLGLGEIAGTRMRRLRAATLSVDLLFKTMSAVNSFQSHEVEFGRSLTWDTESTGKGSKHPPILFRLDRSRTLGWFLAERQLGLFAWSARRDLKQLMEKEKLLKVAGTVAWLNARLPSLLGDDINVPSVDFSKAVEIMFDKRKQQAPDPAIELTRMAAEMKPALDSALAWWLQQPTPDMLDRL